jgi:lysophospholipase L1-like esterase
VLLAASDWTMQPFSFRACSGGVVHDIYGIRQSTLQVAPQVVADDSSVKLVTLTIGGNDLDFSTIVERCFGEGNCITHKSVWPKGAVGPDKKPIAKTTLTQWAATEEPVINAQVLTLLGELKGSYPNARIIVLGYPYLFPTSNASVGRGLTDCGIFLRRYSPAERNWVDWQINKVDTMYAADAKAEGLEFISPIAAWIQHEPCGSTGQYTSAEKLNLTDFGDAFDVNGSFHPNSSGQATFAGLISCYLDNHPNKPDRKTPTAQQKAATAPPSATPSGAPTDPFPVDPCDSIAKAPAK